MDLSEPFELDVLDLRADAKRGRRILLAALLVGVHAHDDPPARAHLAGGVVGGLGDLRPGTSRRRCRRAPLRAWSRRRARRDGRRPPRPGARARRSSSSTNHEPPSGSATWHHAGLLGDDLLGPQRQAGGVLGRQGQRLVEGVGVQALGAPEHPGQRLDGDADEVHLGLLGRQGDACGLGVEAQLGRTARRSPRSDRASSAPRCAGPPGTWRSPRRSRCGR